MTQEVFRSKRGCGRRQISSSPGNDENVEKMRTLVRTDRRIGIRMTTEELNMNTETVRQISTTNLNMKKVCAKMVPRNPPLFSQ